MSMLDFVKLAFAEGGPQMEFLASLLDCKDITTDMSLEDRFHLILAELLRMKTQIQTLQAQVSQMIQERDKMMLLIWTELSRMGHKINPDGSTNTGICDTPVRALIEEAAKNLREEPTFRSLLGPPGYASSSSNDLPPEMTSSGRGVKRMRQGSATSEGSRLLLHQGRAVKSDGRSSHGSMELDPRDEELLKAMKEDGSSPVTSISALNGHGGTTLPSPISSTGAQTSPEQRVLIDSWIMKQAQGAAQHPNMLAGLEGVEPGDWYCHVCGSIAKDGLPGDHFCYGRYENHRDNLKVFCQYCRKGTARMPDLRVHFRKIVYCRDLRAQLKLALSRGGMEKLTAASSPPSMTSPPEEGDGTANEDDTHTHTPVAVQEEEISAIDKREEVESPTVTEEEGGETADCLSD
eukprot:Blabericola_migrator_1__3207@NODE_1944_length_3529_cov_107_922299_g1242_i0_p1_GENE_NODE_1944_length_3529_cov_107_922299_g1242_i0NODE_1944_length_3529_cov_107_922299_g1242_i0_p1_ORF_typecomplete_len406_score86_14SKA2/PF16740_5/0_063zfRanBP/PF00641_18/0_48LRS4/PF10422_9/0_5LRS4/PF10422_9/3_4e03PHD_2/PF13831_6/8PHD_2/PF13831_6/49_NODE_1944_length_3529_cov_107_922299_g1242_i02011418